MRRATTLVTAALIALGGAGAAGAATPSATSVFAAGLKLEVKATFKKDSPSLSLVTLTCRAPTAGKVYHCLADFTDASAKANVVVGITASLKKSTPLTDGVSANTISWSTTTHSCTTLRTHAPMLC